MIEVPDNNIDTKLGVKNLVNSNNHNNNNIILNSQPLSATNNNKSILSSNASRNNVDSISVTNNGSVIYAQSNQMIKNGLKSHSSPTTIGGHIVPVEAITTIINDRRNSYQYSQNNITSRSLQSTKESQIKFTSSLMTNSNDINGIVNTNNKNSHSSTSPSKLLEARKTSTINNHQQPRLVNNNHTSSNNNNNILPDTNGKIHNESSSLANKQSNSKEEDLNHQMENNYSNKWSNGTLNTTSDLLF